MKHLKYIFMAFAMALLATSCSQDELLEDGGIEEVPVTFTATVDYAIETQDDDTLWPTVGDKQLLQLP